MNPKKHSAATGEKAKITAKEGSVFSAGNGWITGKNLRLVKDKLIVQSWRGKDWRKNDPDSTFVISLDQQGKNTTLHAIHANIPDKQVKGIDKGWYEFYWEPWKKCLAGNSPAKSRKM
jgi:activator of HSP90 ATPase